MSVMGQLNRAVTALVKRGLVELTLPAKPKQSNAEVPHHGERAHGSEVYGVASGFVRRDRLLRFMDRGEWCSRRLAPVIAQRALLAAASIARHAR